MRGLLLAFSAYFIWGAFPLYFSFLSHVPTFEVLANRIVWAFFSTIIIIFVLGKRKQLLQMMGDRHIVKWLGLSSLLIAINWLVFIWAVAEHRVLESSLGYFLTPLVSLLLGRLFLNESLNRLQVIAAFLAVIAVCLELVTLGKLPWISIVLALSFGFYGLVRKQLPINSLIGLTVETLLILPFALIYLYWHKNDLAIGMNNSTTIFLVASGLVTAIPLLLFAAATKHLDLTVIGFVMYINPTMQFLTAVYLFNEPYPPQRIVTFILIWIGLIFFMSGLWQRSRGNKLALTIK